MIDKTMVKHALAFTVVRQSTLVCLSFNFKDLLLPYSALGRVT